MNINTIKNAIRVGHLEKSTTHDLKLVLINDKDISNEDIRDNRGRVYFLTINDEVFKIGGSQAKGGIKSTIAAYQGGFAKGMSPRTYCIWKFCRQQIELGNKVEFYFMLAPKIFVDSPTLSGWKKIETTQDFHLIEENCLEEYLEKEGKYPYLNMQESGKRWKDMDDLLEGYQGII